MKILTVKILFGEIEVNNHIWENKELSEFKENIKTFHFKNESEKEGFLNGLNEGIGWQAYYIL